VFGSPPSGAWTVTARDPTFAGSIQESDVIEFTLVWLDRDGKELESRKVSLEEESAYPLPVLNAALRKFTDAMRKHT